MGEIVRAAFNCRIPQVLGSCGPQQVLGFCRAILIVSRRIGVDPTRHQAAIAEAFIGDVAAAYAGNAFGKADLF
jgi:hypothetical protein